MEERIEFRGKTEAEQLYRQELLKYADILRNKAMNGRQ